MQALVGPLDLIVCYYAVQFDIHPDYLTFPNSENYRVIPTSTIYTLIDVFNQLVLHTL